MPRTSSTPSTGSTSNHGLLSTWDGAITMLAGSGVGGGTLVNWMTSIVAPDGGPGRLGPRARPRRRRRRRVGRRRRRRSSRSSSVAPATVIPPKDEAILRGAAALGWEAAPTRRNADRLRRLRQLPVRLPAGREAVAASGSISLAPTRRAPGSSPRVRVVRVARRGWPGRRRRGHGDRHGPVTGRPLDDAGRPGVPVTRRLVVRARSVVLSAGALRTPAILQATGLEHPAIGRHLRLHPVPVVAGRFDEPIDMWRGTMQAARSLEFGDAADGRNGYVIESAPGPPGPARPGPALGGHRRRTRE